MKKLDLIDVQTALSVNCEHQVLMGFKDGPKWIDGCYYGNEYIYFNIIGSTTIHRIPFESISNGLVDIYQVEVTGETEYSSDLKECLMSGGQL